MRGCDRRPGITLNFQDSHFAMEQSIGGRSASTHNGKRARQTDCSGLVEESTQSQDVSVSKKRASKKAARP